MISPCNDLSLAVNYGNPFRAFRALTSLDARNPEGFALFQKGRIQFPTDLPARRILLRVSS